jgi:hypothetical protein
MGLFEIVGDEGQAQFCPIREFALEETGTK